MNATEFVDDNSDTFSGNLLVQSTQRYHNSSQEPTRRYHNVSEEPTRCYNSFSDEPTRRYNSSSEEPWSDFTTTNTLVDIIICVAYALGIPGNILSAIVWLRRHLANENQSAIYLAVLAIDDLVGLLFDGSAMVTGSAGVRVSVLFDFGIRQCGYCPHLGHAAVERVRYIQVTVSVIRTSR